MGLTKIKSFTKQCTRVWHLLRKPKMDEFKKVSIVAAIGLGVIGLIGFAIALAMSFVFPN
jgi:protein translocase SEC61 complex gamma subunit